ncbi:hypothetical protein BD410DRAFT_175296 [Rickenella mellea]|uniref:Uncharacterized protein n=1 Tax=Rickenella mellea TaxID=50990 RepID=A0A4Y7Q8T8_9AGAM|nr:hypothetical protein BD410DRAFT_175296 [Rickenella mellea]
MLIHVRAQRWWWLVLCASGVSVCGVGLVRFARCSSSGLGGNFGRIIELSTNTDNTMQGSCGSSRAVDRCGPLKSLKAADAISISSASGRHLQTPARLRGGNRGILSRRLQKTGLRLWKQRLGRPMDMGQSGNRT